MYKAGGIKWHAGSLVGLG